MVVTGESPTREQGAYTFHVGVDMGASAVSTDASSAVAVLDAAGRFVEQPRLFRRAAELVAIVKAFPLERTIIAVDAPRSVPDISVENYARRSAESQLQAASKAHVGSFYGAAALFIRWSEIERAHFADWQIVEVYPRTLWQRLGLPGVPKDGKANAVAINAAIHSITGLDVAGFKSHQLDATLAAFTALCYARGQVELFGNPGEGRLVVPDLSKPAGSPLPIEPIAEPFQRFPSQAGAVPDKR